jgi:hypothetical protein
MTSCRILVHLEKANEMDGSEYQKHLGVNHVTGKQTCTRATLLHLAHFLVEWSPFRSQQKELRRRTTSSSGAAGSHLKYAGREIMPPPKLNIFHFCRYEEELWQCPSGSGSRRHVNFTGLQCNHPCLFSCLSTFSWPSSQ